MALNFPNTPNDGDTYDNFYYDATAGIWRRQLTVTDLSDLDTKPINDLDDVSVQSTTPGDVLQFDGTNWTNKPFLINTSSPQDDQFLKYSSSGWENITLSSSELSDFNIVSSTNNEIIYYDGTEWVNGIPPLLETDLKTSSYTLGLTDVGKIVAMNASSIVDLTIPENDSVQFPVGSVVGIYNASSSDVNVIGDTGVTLRNSGSVGEFQEASVRKRGTNEWVMVGG